MPVLQLSQDEGLFYEWETPVADGGLTFVIVDAGGDLRGCDARLGAPLRAAGHGTLLFHYRGQPTSPARPGHADDDAARLADLRTLIDALRPARPVLVGDDLPGIDCLRLPRLPMTTADELLAAAREVA
jgi:hypothetical protein